MGSDMRKPNTNGYRTEHPNALCDGLCAWRKSQTQQCGQKPREQFSCGPRSLKTLFLGLFSYIMSYTSVKTDKYVNCMFVAYLSRFSESISRYLLKMCI